MKRFLLILLCFMLTITALPACTQPAGSGETDTAGVDSDGIVTESTAEETVGTGADTDSVMPETLPETQEEVVIPVKPLDIQDRYFIFRIWNFTERPLSTFKTIVDTVVEDGFNAIKVHIPWYRVETTAGMYDYAVFDEMIDYVVKEKGLKVAISLDMTRRKGDTVISEADIMRDPAGNLCIGGSETGDRMQISFNSEYAVSKAVAFYRDAVGHYHERYGDEVLLYLPAFSQYAETEYWCAGEYDFSDNAKMAFRAFLQEHYRTVDALNSALGTSLGSFEEAMPPASGTAGDSLGQLWYAFRHASLKAVVDRLANAQDEVAKDTKFAIQLGCVYDTASVLRGTFGVADLCENVDVLWVDDGPLMNHHFSMDYIRSILPDTVELAQEIDGPHQNGATPEMYLEQGLVCFERGCTYVSAANWGIDDNYKTYRPVWQEIAATWLGEETPAVVQPKEDCEIVEISLLELFRRRNADRYITEYRRAAKNGEFVYIKVVDDLTGNLPAEPSAAYAFPGDYSTEQGKGNWYYNAASRKGMTDMTYDAANNRWKGSAEYCLISSGSMHPDAEDAALVFKAPQDGEVVCTYSLAVASEQSDGVIFYILHNGEEVTIGEERNGGILVTAATPADGEITLTVAEGDEIAFIINKNKFNSYDATAAAVSVEYK
ncbi:MAG: beta-galactosidase [Clostridia bacterium]|nr:beta-galactosidase [Clostridia bacterium]